MLEVIKVVRKKAPNRSYLRRDITGLTFGRLTVTDKLPGGRWLCSCECGNKKSVVKSHLVNGVTRSCGCLARELSSVRGKIHGMTDTRLYRAWKNMRNRCCSPSTDKYEDYGGRGITVCAEWANSSKSFIDWALANGYADNLEIDREDNNSGYSPNNCRWVTRSLNTVNQRRRKDNLSGYIGVHPDSGKWVACIQCEHHRTHIGAYPTAWEAAEARNDFIKKHNLPHKIQEKIDE